jgi:Tfp pilus assembly protein PilV
MTVRKNAKRGMSLIEVIISMFFLGVMLILYSAALNTVSLSKKLRNENTAYHVASKKMEELRSIPFSSLPGSGTIADPTLANIPSGSGSFTVSDHVGFTGLKELTVTVTWNDGAARQVVIRSLSGSGGINP